MRTSGRGSEIYLRTKFCRSGSSGLVVKPKNKKYCHTAATYYFILQNHALLNAYFPRSMTTIISTVNSKYQPVHYPFHNLSRLQYCYYPISEIRNYSFWISSEVKTFTPSFVKIRQIVRKLKWGNAHAHRRYSDRTSFPFRC